MVVAMIGTFGIYYCCCSLRQRFGDRVSSLAFLLIIFNQNVLFFLNRISMDSTMSILNIWIFGLWLNNRVFLLMLLSVSDC
jgi:hypothetical protein